MNEALNKKLFASCSHVNGRPFILRQSLASQILGLINTFLRWLSITMNGVENWDSRYGIWFLEFQSGCSILRDSKSTSVKAKKSFLKSTLHFGFDVMHGKDVVIIFILAQAHIFRYFIYILLFVNVLPLPTCSNTAVDCEQKGVCSSGTSWRYYDEALRTLAAGIRWLSMNPRLYLACPKFAAAWIAASVQSVERHRWALYYHANIPLSNWNDLWQLSWKSTRYYFRCKAHAS